MVSSTIDILSLSSEGINSSTGGVSGRGHTDNWKGTLEDPKRRNR